jgi:hypothetical protein
MKLDRRVARTVSFCPLDLCLISTFSYSLSMLPRCRVGNHASGQGCGFSVSLRSRSMSSREVSKEINVSDCSFIALERVMFSIQRLLRTILGTWAILILSMSSKAIKSG